jgi:hypothetical protein
MTLIATKGFYTNDVPPKLINYDSYLDENGQIVTVSGKDEVAQAQVSNLKLWRGECDYDKSNGVNYLFIFNKDNITVEEMDYFIQIASFKVNDNLDADTLAQYGIKEITSIDYTLDKNQKILNIKIKEVLNSGQNLEVTV